MRCRKLRSTGAMLWAAVACTAAMPAVGCAAEATTAPATQGGFAPPVVFKGDGDHRDMMEQLGIRTLRPGADPKNPSTFDEKLANSYPLPELMTMADGTHVTSPAQWEKRRAELREDFEREVYGRIPPNTPHVTWDVIAMPDGMSGTVKTKVRRLVGHVNNSQYPLISVNIEATLTTPADATGAVPVMIEFGGFGRPPGTRRAPATGPGRAGGGLPQGGMPGAPAFTRRPNGAELVLAHGWGFATISPGSIQTDGPALTSGIIGLCNHGQPRKPEDWGALRAWQWGVSRMLDYLETDSTVDAKRVGIEGLSRYGKAALVTEAFEDRIAIGFIGSSGEGGAKLHRHIFGEMVENLTGGEYYWMAGNFLKYGASEATGGAKTAADLPVDSHELIALCAPRPCFISYGVPAGGDPAWVDAHGSFMAAVAAGPAYRLLGKRDLGTSGDYLKDEMPPVKTLIGGELAWRQHEGGHSVAENWPAFIAWAAMYWDAGATGK